MSEAASKETYIIIHGHFYQPPREDPWTGEIDRQDSAYPDHDWNARINKQCYAANADARTLDKYGQIAGIINNYAHISFNFGPTLLNWLEDKDPEAYQRILEADRLSMEDNEGHGNAIAQVYNHIILPLASTEDKYTQVRWGLADFKARFGRDAEGIWLAETAVNLDTVNVLIDCGVQFIILAPTQAEAIRVPGEAWEDVNNNDIDTSRPYYIKGKQGRLAVFFYDLDISKSVGFEHLLTDAANFSNRLFGAAEAQEQDIRMVNIATDGESYGHHEPFANMCLAGMIHNNRREKRFRMVNYGYFLEKFPPEQEVRLKAGKNGLGTAWSCAHGVGRWMEDCGCSDGGQPGWHQRWRAPLRAAFDHLRDDLLKVSLEASEELLKDFNQARDDYISVLMDSGDASLNAFFERNQKRALNDEERQAVRLMMEAQKYAMFMYTSCGWFFADISGIETVQCMRYAARALELGSRWLPEDQEKKLLDDLGEAPSNIPTLGSGRRVFQEFISPYIMDGAKLANQFVLEHLLAAGPEEGSMYFYNFAITDKRTFIKEDGEVQRGIVSIRDSQTWQQGRYIFYTLRSGHLDITNYIKAFEDERLTQYLDLLVEENTLPVIRQKSRDWFVGSYSLADLKFDCKERLVRELFKTAFSELHELRSDKMDDYIELLTFYARLGIPIPEVERASIEATLNVEISSQLERLEECEAAVDFEKVAAILAAARKTSLNVNQSTIEALFALKIGSRMDAFLEKHEEEDYEQLIQLIDFANKSQLDYNRKAMENRIFDILNSEILDMINEPSSWQGNKLDPFVEQMLHLAELLNISVREFRSRLEKMRQTLEGDSG